MHKYLLLLFSTALVHGLLYAVIIPPWQGPDEIAHFEYSRLLAEVRRPLTYADASPELEREILSSLFQYRAWTFIHRESPDPIPARLAEAPFFGGSRTFSRFSLAYVPYAIAVWPVLDQDVITQLYIMRFLSAVLGALVVLLAYRTARLVAPQFPALAAGTALFILFLPQHAFITAIVSDGNLAELLASTALYLLVKMLRTGLTAPHAALCLACTLAAVLTKATAYFLIPLMLVAGPMTVLRPFSSDRLILDWRKGLAVLLSALLLGAILGAGLAAAPPLEDILSLLAQNLSSAGEIGEYAADLSAEGRFSNALGGTFKSFWVTFGWMSLPLPSLWYNLLAILSVLSLAGLALRLRSLLRWKADIPLYLLIGLAALLPVAILIVWFVAYPSGLYFYQGRYLFGGIVPMAILLAGGWLLLAPDRHAGLALKILLAGMVLLDAVALLNLTIPFYYS